MCKRNSPNTKRNSTGCVRETPQINNNNTHTHTKTNKNKQTKKRCQHGICKRNSPDKKKRKKEVSTGCGRETPPIKMNPAWDV